MKREIFNPYPGQPILISDPTPFKHQLEVRRESKMRIVRQERPK